MKKLFILLLIGYIFFFPYMSFAQAPEAEEKKADNATFNQPPEEKKIFQAKIEARDIVRAGETVSFDAANSAFGEEEIIYRWDFGDGNRDEGIEVNHIYNRAGIFRSILEIKNKKGELLSKIEKEIFIYEKLILMITDNYAERQKIDGLFSYAKNQGIYVKIIGDYDKEGISDFLSEEILMRKMTESWEDFAQTDKIIIWTKSSVGLTVLPRFKQLTTDKKPVFKGKTVVFVSNGNLSTLANIAQSSFNIVNPDRIVLTGAEALWSLVDVSDSLVFISNLKDKGINFRVIDSKSQKIGILNFMSYLVNYMIEKGIPSNTIKLILMLPIIVTIIAFMKQVVGMTTLGVYTPSIITLSFIALDLRYGLIILLILLLIGTLSRFMLSHYRLLYIPRMSILLTIVSLTILGILTVGSYFDISELVSISIFPMLIMSTLVEKFVSIQTGQGFKSAMLLMSETIFVSIICYYIAEWDVVKTLMLGHPELILLLLLINIFLGRWTGLRVFEYIRFREVIKHAEEE